MRKQIKRFYRLHNGDQIDAARKLHESSIHFALVIADEENLTTYNLHPAFVQPMSLSGRLYAFGSTDKRLIL